MKLFEPYAKYAFHSCRPPNELENRLRDACRRSFWPFNRTASKFLFRKSAGKIELHPRICGRNTMRPMLYLTLHSMPDFSGSVISVVAAPLDMRWFVWLFYGFLLIFLAAGICFQVWQTLFALIIFPISWCIFHITRSIGEEELPRIISNFQELLEQIDTEMKGYLS